MIGWIIVFYYNLICISSLRDGVEVFGQIQPCFLWCTVTGISPDRFVIDFLRKIVMCIKTNRLIISPLHSLCSQSWSSTLKSNICRDENKSSSRWTTGHPHSLHRALWRPRTLRMKVFWANWPRSPVRRHHRGSPRNVGGVIEVTVLLGVTCLVYDMIWIAKDTWNEILRSYRASVWYSFFVKTQFWGELFWSFMCLILNILLHYYSWGMWQLWCFSLFRAKSSGSCSQTWSSR